MRMCYGDHRNNDPGNRHPETSREAPRGVDQIPATLTGITHDVTASDTAQRSGGVHGVRRRYATSLLAFADLMLVAANQTSR